MSTTEAYPRGIPFRKLMAVKEIAPDTFESLQLAWPPGIISDRTFGGHCYAQSIYAASKTCAKGMVVHNVTGHFLLPGSTEVPFIYKVRRVRDGGVYCLRQVDVFQATKEAHPEMRLKREANTPCFISTISFKRDETASGKTQFSEHQNVPSDHIQKVYRSVLQGLSPEQHPRSPSADADWWLEILKARWINAAETFPGVEIRKVDMAKYNGKIKKGNQDKAGDYRQLCFYRMIIGPDEPSLSDGTLEEDLNLNAAFHIYTSDRNSLFLIQRALGYTDRKASMGSLAHTVILHASAKQLKPTDASGKPKWFVQEAWTPNSGDNRGSHESRMWDFEAGRILATTLQDGMMRLPKEEYARNTSKL
jgi:acyl-CoA thioesterase II